MQLCNLRVMPSGQFLRSHSEATALRITGCERGYRGGGAEHIRKIAPRGCMH
jgi:hypothetical protein